MRYKYERILKIEFIHERRKMNLREKKKRNTQDAIVLSARKLFVEKGYSSTTMGEIADNAEVAVGTLYNYFKSKSEIVLTIVSQDSSGLLQPYTPEELDSLEVEELIWKFTSKLLNFLAAYPRKLLNEMIGAFWESGQETLVDGLASIDLLILEKLTETIAVLKEKDKIKSEAEPQTVALALYGMSTTAIMFYSVSPDVTLEKTQETISAMAGHLCRGIVPDKREGK